MKDKIVIDIGRIMDEVFDAAQSLQDAVHEGFKEKTGTRESFFSWDEDVDLYPAYSYPPLNVFIDGEKNLVFEFALAGFDEKNFQLEFSGDHMLFSAAVAERMKQREDVKYFKHRLKLKDVKEQKYYVPKSKFRQADAQAVYANGMLIVTVPPKEPRSDEESIKVNIKAE